MGLLDETQHSYYNGSDFGNYQFVTLDDIIGSFMAVYVGENKILTKVNRTDVQFHGMRAIQELSYDVLKSKKAQEIEVPPSLKMMLPQDYVNYTKLVRVDANGIERVLYPTGKTSNPSPISQASDGTYEFDGVKRQVTITVPSGSDMSDGDVVALDTVNGRLLLIFHTDSDVNTPGGISSSSTDILVHIQAHAYNQTQIAYQIANAINNVGFHTATYQSGVITVTYNTHYSFSPETTYNSATNVVVPNITINVLSEGTVTGGDLLNQVESDTWGSYSSQDSSDSSVIDYSQLNTQGQRYGLSPQNAQANGTFYIDDNAGFIHFGSNLAGETIILKYISDGLGTDAEMLVHKFAEEAVYKHIMYGLISGRSGIPEYVVQRYKKEKFAETRKAKIRLSNIKMEEFTQVLRGLSKPIK
jgi:hypothetical protein